MIDTTVLLGVGMFTATVLSLVLVILSARSRLVSSGNVTIQINDDPAKAIEVPAGGKLLSTLASQGVFLASACGGGGTCAQCRCRVTDGGGSILATEEGHFTRGEIGDNWRLSCQVAVKQDLKIEVPEDALGVQRWECEVESNDNVASMIKELNLKLPEGADVNFRAGGYVQLEIPPYKMDWSTIDVQDEYREDWDTFNFWDLKSEVKETTIRAYSMANYPEEKGILKFNIRVSPPPPRTNGLPPGAMTSYVANLRKGDKITVFGPYGDFFVKDTPAEKIWIGGGAGMAPLRSHIFDELLRKGTTAKMSYWYGARSLREMFYKEEFDRLEEEYENFSWHVALSDAREEDNWDGLTGFIHAVAFENYLKDHPNPEDCEYYMCGPPIVNQLVSEMLEDLGVEPENIAFDDFGG
ncbi:MAG: NADH:ubiquinone reductase (Na(+)-transporting) subunit F [Candidatus Azotimanducaceae bacterium]